MLDIIYKSLITHSFFVYTYLCINKKTETLFSFYAITSEVYTESKVKEMEFCLAIK